MSHSVSTNGMVYLKTRMTTLGGSEFKANEMLKDIQAWYKDSLVILESPEINYVRVNNVEKAEQGVHHYIFIDLRTRSFYEYKHFSDTAQLLRSYTQADSVKIEGSWSFFKYNKLVPQENQKELPDTVINGVKLKRLSFSKTIESQEGNWNTIYHAYLRKDKKNTLFHLDRAFDEKMGYPMVRFDYIIENRTGWHSMEIDFASNKLSKEEINVFDAWEQYAKHHPAF